MLSVDERVKELYRADSTDKHLILDFYRDGEDEPYLHLSSSNVQAESMEIDESLSSSENLDFGSCEATQLKITLFHISDVVKGSRLVIYQMLEGIWPAADLFPGDDIFPDGYKMPLGTYIVQSAERQTNRIFLDITALDQMSLFDVNVAEWYNILPFPMTLREFRSRLCQHIGVTEYVPDYLPNDGMTIEKTIAAEELFGRDALIACEQLNGVFGHFDRNGVLQHIVLQSNYVLTPADSLYPSDDLYPAEPGDMNDQVYDELITQHMYTSCRFEDYTVKSIEAVQLRQEEDDIGAIYGKGNCLVIEGNFLLYGKGAEELQQLAKEIYGMVSNRPYIPYECDLLKGLPYLEVGDSQLIEADEGDIVSYVIKRTMKGIYALKDTYSATGEELRTEEQGANAEIIRLKGKAAYLKKNVDEVSANLVDLEKQTEAKLTITAEKIEAEVKRASEAEGNLSSLISQTAESITLMVKKGEVSAQLSIESGGIDIKGDRFSWTATNSSLTADGTLTVNQGLFKGSIDVGNGQFTVDSSGKVIAKSIEVGTSSSRATLYGSTVLATNFSCNSSFNVDCYANMADIGGNTISCGTLRANHIYGSIDDFSDRRLKQNIHPVDAETAIRIIKQLKPVSYSMKRYDREGVGFIAQDVQKICLKQGIDLPLYGRRGKYLTIPYINYIPLLVAVVQSQQKEIDRLKRLIG
jgi:hypothetical protein